MAANRRAATDDSLALVVVHNYRHALELELKAVVRALVAGEHARNPDGVDQQVAQVADRLERTHSLQALVDGLRELACRVGWTLAPIVADVCGELHRRDPAGDYFRYPDVRWGGESKPARLAPLYPDVPGSHAAPMKRSWCCSGCWSRRSRICMRCWRCRRPP